MSYTNLKHTERRGGEKERERERERGREKGKGKRFKNKSFWIDRLSSLKKDRIED